MMKLIHTSDWHLGHLLYNFDRREEQQAMLDWMAGLVREEQPDVFLLAGDVYDSSQPSASVQTLFSDGLLKILEACKDMQIVCIPGNHDSASKLNIFRSPWARMKVAMLSNVTREVDDLSDYIVKVEGKGFVVAVPYAADRNMPEDFFKKLADQVAQQNQEQLPVVLTAHLAVSGSDFRGHENANEIMVGGLECQQKEAFGEGFDYVALGHIHKAQYIFGTDRRIRYSGTPIPISFDEAMGAGEHGVTVVSIERHGDLPQFRTIPFQNPRPLVNLPLEGFGEWESVKGQFEAFPDDIPAYIRLNVLVDGHLSVVANSEANQIAAGKQCRFCLINPKRKASSQHNAGYQPLTTTEFQKMTPKEVARMFLETKQEEQADDLLKLFEIAMKEVRDED